MTVLGFTLFYSFLRIHHNETLVVNCNLHEKLSHHHNLLQAFCASDTFRFTSVQEARNWQLSQELRPTLRSGVPQFEPPGIVQGNLMNVMNKALVQLPLNFDNKPCWTEVPSMPILFEDPVWQPRSVSRDSWWANKSKVL